LRLAGAARRWREISARFVRDGRRDEHDEEALRDLVLADNGDVFGFEGITRSPWIEIDFPDDVRRAAEPIMPRLEAAPAAAGSNPIPADTGA